MRISYKKEHLQNKKEFLEDKIEHLSQKDKIQFSSVAQSCHKRLRK